jgi:hypothetical protein
VVHHHELYSYSFFLFKASTTLLVLSLSTW